MRLKFYKRSAFSVAVTAKDEVSLMLHSFSDGAQKNLLVELIQELFFASGSRDIFPVANSEFEDIQIRIPRCLLQGSSLENILCGRFC